MKTITKTPVNILVVIAVLALGLYAGNARCKQKKAVLQVTRLGVVKNGKSQIFDLESRSLWTVPTEGPCTENCRGGLTEDRNKLLLLNKTLPDVFGESETTYLWTYMWDVSDVTFIDDPFGDHCLLIKGKETRADYIYIYALKTGEKRYYSVRFVE